jgi:hypothetical protein
MKRRVGWLGMCVLCALAGCAQGFDQPEPGMAAPGGDPVPGGGAAGMAGSSSMAGGGAAFVGEACAMGARERCTCDDGGEGTRVCQFDRSSPTQGSFSACAACMTGPASGQAGTGGSTAGSGGAAGRGGTGGASGTAGASGGSAAGRGGSSGTGGSGTSGGSGTGGSGGRDAAWCVFVPIPLPGLCN